MGAVATVREQLAEQRHAGRDFAAAWPAALEALAPEDRREWFEALEDTSGAWEAAYQARPATRSELALSAVGEDPERELPTGEPDAWERICAACDGPIAEGKRLDARFCSSRCTAAVARLLVP